MSKRRHVFDYLHGVKYVGLSYDNQRCFQIKGGYILVPAGVIFHNEIKFDRVSILYNPSNLDREGTKRRSVSARSPDRVYDAYVGLLEKLKRDGVQLLVSNEHNEKTVAGKHWLKEVLSVTVPKGVRVIALPYCSYSVYACINTYHQEYVGCTKCPDVLQSLVNRAVEVREQALSIIRKEFSYSYEDACILHKRKPKIF